MPWHGSGDVPALTRANAFLVAEADRAEWPAGDRIRVLHEMKKLSHFDAAGSPRMVDVSAKPETRRTARAHAFVRMRPGGAAQPAAKSQGQSARDRAHRRHRRRQEDRGPDSAVPSADAVARGCGGASGEGGVRIIASAATTAQTGVEMEALTAAAVAALTVYDMTKALDKSIEIQDVYLLEKTGGKSGEYRRPAR